MQGRSGLLAAPGTSACDAQGLFGSGAVPSGRTVRCTGMGWLTGQAEELRAVRRDLKGKNNIDPKTIVVSMAASTSVDRQNLYKHTTQ